MEDRQRAEAELFTRYEARIVAVEIGVSELRALAAKYVPIVDKLRDSDLVADAIADRLRETATMKLTKVHVVIGVAALFLPAVVSALLTYALLHAAG